jgi:hypothetical protein
VKRKDAFDRERLPTEPAARRRALLERRKLLESRRGRLFVSPGAGLLRPASLAAALYVRLGAARWLTRNPPNPVLRRAALEVPGLDPRLEGLRILHVSDTHFRRRGALASQLREVVADASADLCVITGDLPAWAFGPCAHVFAGVQAVLQNHDFLLGVYGVLGNHDTLRFVAGLDALGVRVLMNEHVLLEWRGAPFVLAGVDDPHWFRTADPALACQGAPPDVPRLLLAHSPEAYKEAAGCGVNLYLCGHTHGGQVCLPGGVPIMKNARAPRKLCAGAWRWRGMAGYTTRGAGAGMMTLRLNCPAEAALLTLTRSQDG